VPIEAAVAMDMTVDGADAPVVQMDLLSALKAKLAQRANIALNIERELYSLSALRAELAVRRTHIAGCNDVEIGAQSDGKGKGEDGAASDSNRKNTPGNMVETFGNLSAQMKKLKKMSPLSQRKQARATSSSRTDRSALMAAIVAGRKLKKAEPVPVGASRQCLSSTRSDRAGSVAAIIAGRWSLTQRSPPMTAAAKKRGELTCPSLSGAPPTLAEVVAQRLKRRQEEQSRRKDSQPLEGGCSGLTLTLSAVVGHSKLRHLQEEAVEQSAVDAREIEGIFSTTRIIPPAESQFVDPTSVDECPGLTARLRRREYHESLAERARARALGVTVKVNPIQMSTAAATPVEIEVGCLSTPDDLRLSPTIERQTVCGVGGCSSASTDCDCEECDSEYSSDEDWAAATPSAAGGQQACDPCDPRAPYSVFPFPFSMPEHMDQQCLVSRRGAWIDPDSLTQHPAAETLSLDLLRPTPAFNASNTESTLNAANAELGMRVGTPGDRGGGILLGWMHAGERFHDTSGGLASEDFCRVKFDNESSGWNLPMSSCIILASALPTPTFTLLQADRASPPPLSLPPPSSSPVIPQPVPPPLLHCSPPRPPPITSPYAVPPPMTSPYAQNVQGSNTPYLENRDVNAVAGESAKSIAGGVCDGENLPAFISTCAIIFKASFGDELRRFTIACTDHSTITFAQLTSKLDHICVGVDSRCHSDHLSLLQSYGHYTVEYTDSLGHAAQINCDRSLQKALHIMLDLQGRQSVRLTVSPCSIDR
jgi:hypothetical protein